MKRLFIMLSLVLFISAIFGVTWTVSLVDSYGDGWNGGALTVLVNGSPVLTGITLASGYGPADFPFEVQHADQVTTTYTPGSWAYENEYYIYDHNGELIASQGVDDVNPESITVPIIVSAATNAPLSPTSPNPAHSATGIATSGNLSWTFGANTETYDLWFGPAGAMVQVVSGAAATSSQYTYSNLQYLTTYQWRVVSHNTQTRLTTQGPIWSFSTTPPPGTVIIGSGTDNMNLPIYPYYGYTYSQSIYLQSEINTAGQQINTISYYWNGAGAANVSNQWTIWMGYTNDSVMPASFYPIGDQTQVFNGEVPLPAIQGWITIPLTVSFPYNNTQNLVVTVMESEPAYDSSSLFFYSTNLGVNRSLVAFNDGTAYNPTLPPTGSYRLGIPNTMFTFNDIPTGMPEAVILQNPAEGITIPKFGYNFTWQPSPTGGFPTGYDFYIGPNGTEDIFSEYLYLVEGLTTASYNPAAMGHFDFDYAERYTWTVVAYNADGYGPGAPVQEFVIENDPSITSFPYTQDFETWPPQNWNLTGGTYSFAPFVDAEINTWAMANYWSAPAGNTYYMTTPPIVSDDPLELTFLWSHIYHVSYPDDALTVQISDDLSTWNDLWFKDNTDLDSADGAGNTLPGTGVTARINIPTSYIGAPFWIRFFGYSGYGPNLYIDDVHLGLPPEHDVGVSSHNIPEVVGAEPFLPIVNVVNYGLNTETFDVNLMIGTGYNNTIQVLSLAPGANADVSFPSFTPVVGTAYEFTAQTLLPTDQNPANNSVSGGTVCLDLNKQVYADVAYSGGGATGPATFMLNNPGVITDLPEANPWEGFFLSGADWNEGWYGATYSLNTWLNVDHTTGVATVIGNTGAFTGVAFDPNTGTWYGSTDLDLYTIDPLTGATTLVGPLNAGGVMIGIAYDAATSTLYGVDIGSDALYTINTTTGASTVVGSLGIDINYAQDLAIDQSNGHLFLAGYTTAGSLYWINKQTGSALLVGAFQGGWELTGFAIPWTSGALDTPIVVIANDGSLSWDSVPGADFYSVHKSSDPYGTFNSIDTTTLTSWTDPNFPADMSYYQVIAHTGSRSMSREELRIEGDPFRHFQASRSNSTPSSSVFSPQK